MRGIIHDYTHGDSPIILIFSFNIKSNNFIVKGGHSGVSMIGESLCIIVCSNVVNRCYNNITLLAQSIDTNLFFIQMIIQSS